MAKFRDLKDILVRGENLKIDLHQKYERSGKENSIRKILIVLREGLKKYLVENSNKGGGLATDDISTRNKMGLKHWIFPNYHFKTPGGLDIYFF